MAPVRPIELADGKTHLVYELLLINQSAFVVTVGSVAVLDDESGAVIAELGGGDLAMVLRLSLFGAMGTTLQPSQSAFIFIDAALAAGSQQPSSVRHRFSLSQALPVAREPAILGGLPIVPPTDFAPQIVFETAAVPTDLAPVVVLTPPVRGANWLMLRACCALTTSHRGTTSIYGGVVLVPERFAVDFVQMFDDGLLTDGPGNAATSYRHYGQPVYAVADGIVVAARNTEPDQVPGGLPLGLTGNAAGGNNVILDIGGGRYAYYAHMQPGSVLVKAGDRVASGEIIGVIGNSGNTFAPHLHFHVMDRPDTLAADGLPYALTSFTGQGMLVGDALAVAFSGKPAPIDQAAFAGVHANRYPLNNQVIDFGN